MSLSHETSSGRYGAPTSTRIRQTTLGLRHRGEGWTAELQVPWVQVRDPAGAGLPDAAQGGTRAAEQGLGDAWIKLGVELREADTDRSGFDLVFKLKTRTGDAARGLGTGGLDQAVQLEWFRPFDRWSAFGHAGWRHTGDVPGSTPYADPFYASAGLQRAIGGGTELGASYDWRGRITSLGPQREATVYAARTDGPWRYQLYVTAGFSRASADAAVGVSLRRRF